MSEVISEMLQKERREGAGFASLHPGLIARKGQATPAPAKLSVISREPDTQPQAAQHDAHKKSADHHADKPRVTLRLTDRQRRLLRLVSAATDRSNQEILSSALDRHLTRIIGEELGDCKCLRKFVLERAQNIEKGEG